MVIRLFPRKKTDLTTIVEVLYETDECEEQLLDVERPTDLELEGAVDVKVLCVYGAGSLVDTGWSDIHVIDVSEDTEQGHAPTLEVTALKKKTRALTLGGGDWCLSFVAYESSGLVPASGLAFRFRGQDCVLDDDGRFSHPGVALGDHPLEFEGGTAWAPAVHDVRVECAIRLPFHTVTPEELEAHAFDEWEDGSDELDAFAAFELEDDDEEPVDSHADDDTGCGCSADLEIPPGEEPEYVLSIRCYDAAGRVPLPGLTFVCEGASYTLDADGYALVEDVEIGDCALEFEGGVVWAPAVHDPRVMCALRLPFHEAEEPDEADPGDAWDDPEDPEAFGAFELEDDDEDPVDSHDDSNDTDGGCGAEPDDHELATLVDLLE